MHDLLLGFEQVIVFERQGAAGFSKHDSRESMLTVLAFPRFEPIDIALTQKSSLFSVLTYRIASWAFVGLLPDLAPSPRDPP